MYNVCMNLVRKDEYISEFHEYISDFFFQSLHAICLQHLGFSTKANTTFRKPDTVQEKYYGAI